MGSRANLALHEGFCLGAILRSALAARNRWLFRCVATQHTVRLRARRRGRRGRGGIGQFLLRIGCTAGKEKGDQGEGMGA